MNCNHNYNPCKCRAIEGERLKADALALLEACRKVYVRRGRRAMLEVLLRSSAATGDDVRQSVELPPGIDAHCLGSVPGALAYAKIIQAAGFVRSTRPERHASWLQVWTLIDRPAAERWLADHPDLEDIVEQGEVATVSQGFLFDPQEATTPAAGTVGAGN